MTLEIFFINIKKIVDWFDEYFFYYVYKIPGLEKINTFFRQYFWNHILLEEHQDIVSKVFTLWLCLLCYPFVASIFFFVLKVFHYIFLIFKRIFT
ncbi:hypothetical protein [Candidatus Phytoplasma solani]|uniref:hypothetical protein n=1 Tax=Candidatus Phytoplasma solani TaxID=69896 RepID=UPI00358F128C